MLDIERFFLAFSSVAWQGTKLFLETFGEIAGGSEAYLIGNLTDRKISGLEQYLTAVQTT